VPANGVSANDGTLARRGAAVAIVLSRGSGAPTDEGEILLVRRATYPGDPWSGHIALPGGRHEPGDASLEATARRETFEETGIDLAQASCIAALPPLTPRSVRLPALVIHPFVFAYAGDRHVTLSPELVEAWWHPVAELRRDEAWEMLEVRAGDAMRTVRGYRWREHVIWGITERILAEFFARPELLAAR
jgi:8-oxo-dGTP pyrophosphatase MutT (NUDIX family)